ncbi:T9SS type A sorting domain-containing protein [Pontibacter sp. H249]|uniref:T9SS type A sorting domain-containing protein n=1 Tax=Pontibacter sp. H249 TaxID=3133420 RepID=UPI0030C3C880
MKKNLPFFVIALLALIGTVSSAMAQTTPAVITTTLAATAKAHNGTDFTIEATKNDATAENVRVIFKLTGENAAIQASQIELENEAGEAITVNANGEAELYSGAFANNLSLDYTIDFAVVGSFPYTIELRDAAGANALLDDVSGTVTVTFMEPTINTTLDNISQQDVIATGADVLFRVFLAANDRESEIVTTRLVLKNPADRNNFTLEYATNIELGTEFEALTIGEDGILVFGPEEGFPLQDASRLFRINFSESGTYEYAVQVLKGNNILGFSDETVTVVEGNAIISSTLDEQELDPNIKRAFTVTFDKGNWGADTRYRLRFVLDDPEQAENFVLETAAGTALTFNANGEAYFGDIDGFEVTASTTENFAVTLTDFGTYAYSVQLLRVVTGRDPQVIASSEESVTVPFESATVSTTLNGKEVERDAATTFTVAVTPNDQDPATLVQGRMRLSNPAQAANIVLEYQDEQGAYQPIAINTEGVAFIGPAEGMALSEINGLGFRVTFNAAGTYAYTLDLVAIDGAVVATSNESVESIAPTSIKKGFEDGGFAVYPTLTTGAVKVDLVNARSASIQVVDMLGRAVMDMSNQKGIVSLDLSKVAKGTYVIKIQDGTRVNTQRVVVR